MAAKRAETEPTVLDWFVSLVRFKPIPIPEPGTLPTAPLSLQAVQTESSAQGAAIRVEAAHVRVPIALLLAVVAQIGLASHSNVLCFVGLYLTAAVLIGSGVPTSTMKQ